MGNLSINNGSVVTNKEGMPSIDHRYGPYASVAAAHAALAADDLCAVGLTVGIITGENKVTEYWYQGGTTQAHLVPKQPEAVVYDEQSHIIYINGQAYSGLVLQPLQCDAPYIEHPFNEVEILCGDPDVDIYYTIANWDSEHSSYAPVVVPTAQNGTLYTGPITVSSGQKYKITAVATKANYADSDPVTEPVEYQNITPPESGNLGATESIHNGPTIEF